jgi:hypothetical protein
MPTIIPELLIDLRRGAALDHERMAADEIERLIRKVNELRDLLAEVHNHGETSDLHRRIGAVLGGVDADPRRQSRPDSGVFLPHT